MAHILLNFDSSPQEVQAIREGFRVDEMALTAEEYGLEPRQLLTVSGVARSSLHRALKQERLSPDISNRVYRVLSLFHRAAKLFGNKQDAWDWINSPKVFLQGNCPRDYIDTEPGYRSVEHLIGRLEDGIVT